MSNITIGLIARDDKINEQFKDISEVEKMETILSENPFIGKRTNYQLLVLKIVILRSFYIYYTVSDNTVSILAFKATKEDNNKHQLGI